VHAVVPRVVHPNASLEPEPVHAPLAHPVRLVQSEPRPHWLSAVHWHEPETHVPFVHEPPHQPPQIPENQRVPQPKLSVKLPLLLLQLTEP